MFLRGSVLRPFGPAVGKLPLFRTLIYHLWYCEIFVKWKFREESPLDNPTGRVSVSGILARSIMPHKSVGLHTTFAWERFNDLGPISLLDSAMLWPICESNSCIGGPVGEEQWRLSRSKMSCLVMSFGNQDFVELKKILRLASERVPVRLFEVSAGAMGRFWEVYFDRIFLLDMNW